MKKPSPALVISLVALFASVSGASYATTQLPAGQQLPKKSVGTKQIKKQAVTGKKIAKESIGKGKIKPSAVRTGKIIDGGVTASKIADSGVTSNKIADGAVTGSKIEAGSINASALAPGVLPTYSANLLYASVNADGTLVGDRASGLAEANVAKATGADSKGTYCIESPPITVQSAQATVLSTSAAAGAEARRASVSILAAGAAVPEGCNAENTTVVVYTAKADALEDGAFSLLLLG